MQDGKDDGAAASAMPVLLRWEVEAVALARFEERTPSFEATREHGARHLRAAAEEAGPAAHRARREVLKLEAHAAKTRPGRRGGGPDRALLRTPVAISDADGVGRCAPRRGAIRAADDFQHGTVLWKYMTQNTLRRS